MSMGPFGFGAMALEQQVAALSHLATALAGLILPPGVSIANVDPYSGTIALRIDASGQILYGGPDLRANIENAKMYLPRPQVEEPPDLGGEVGP